MSQNQDSNQDELAPSPQEIEIDADANQESDRGELAPPPAEIQVDATEPKETQVLPPTPRSVELPSVPPTEVGAPPRASGDRRVAPPIGATSFVGAQIGDELRRVSPSQLADYIKSGTARWGTPVYMHGVRYKARDFKAQLEASPLPEYFVPPESLGVSRLRAVFFVVPVALAVGVLCALFVVVGKTRERAAVPTPPENAAAPEGNETPAASAGDEENAEIEFENNALDPDEPSETPQDDAEEAAPESTPESESSEPEKPETDASQSESTDGEESTPESEPSEPEKPETDASQTESTDGEESTPESEPSEPEKPETDASQTESTDGEESESPETAENDSETESGEEKTEDVASEPEPEEETDEELVAEGWLVKPFDVNQTTLPVDFRGHRFQSARDALARPEFQKPERLEGESDEDYAARVKSAAASAAKTPLFGSVLPKSRLAFVIPNKAMVQKDPERWSGVEYATTTYDMKSQTIIVEKSIAGYGVSFFDGLHIAPFLLSNGSYGLALESPYELGFKWANSDSYRWLVRGFSSKEYEEIQDDVCVLCVVVPDYREPGDTGLLESWGNYAIYSREAEFWVFRASTGEILGKFSFDDTLDEKTHDRLKGKASRGSAALRVNRRSL